MPVQPYIFTDKVSLSANSTGTAEFRVDEGTAFKAKKFWITSTGSFDITGIRDNRGNHYTNASSSEPIPSAMLNRPQTAGGGVYEFVPPLELAGGDVLYIDFKDTSGSANTINIAIEGELERA